MTHLCWVERLEVCCVSVGPAQRAEGPQAAAEPGVEHIRLLDQDLAWAILGSSLVCSLCCVARNNVPAQGSGFGRV